MVSDFLARRVVPAIALLLVAFFTPQVGLCSPAKWTILVFMNGDNNLEPDAIINFRQLAKVGSSDEVNVIVQFDRINKYFPFPQSHTNPDWAQTLRFRVTTGMEPVPANALEDIGEADMGKGQTLADFVGWGMQKYPAEHYMLVVWDHGQGWRTFAESLLAKQRSLFKARALQPGNTLIAMRHSNLLLRSGSGRANAQGDAAPFRSAPGEPYRSVSNDETNQSVLYNRDMQDSLNAMLAGKKIDIVGFDACLMSMLETAYALRNTAQFMVGSEELEPGLGWDYGKWLAAVETSVKSAVATGGDYGPEKIAKLTVESYRSTYTDAESGDPATTLSALRLQPISTIATSLSNLSDALIANIDADLQAIIQAREECHIYAPGKFFYHIDLGRFLDRLGQDSSDPQVQSQARAIANSLNSAIVDNYAGSERGGSYGSTGLAIYFPDSEREYSTDPYADGGYEKDNDKFPVEFVQTQHWADFLHVFWSKVP